MNPTLLEYRGRMEERCEEAKIGLIAKSAAYTVAQMSLVRIMSLE